MNRNGKEFIQKGGPDGPNWTPVFFTMVAQKVEKTSQVGCNLTEGALALVESVYRRTNLNDPQELLPHVCAELMDRFPDNSLEYHLTQMHLETTDDIVRTISCFFISKSLYPEKSYLSDSRK